MEEVIQGRTNRKNVENREKSTKICGRTSFDCARRCVSGRYFRWCRFCMSALFVVGTAKIGTDLFFVGATPSKLLTSANSGLLIIIPTAFAVSMEEPPPIATI